MNVKTDPDAVLTNRAVTILKHHGEPMEIGRLARLLDKERYALTRLLAESPLLTHTESPQLVTFAIK